MINKIKISNFILYDDVEIEPSKKSTMIIGDSASGKSLLFKALNIIKGNSSFKNNYFKDSSKNCEISINVNFSNSLELLKDLDIKFNNLSSVCLKILFIKDSNNHYLINETKIKKSDFYKITSKLLSILNQNESSLILDSEYLIDTIDFSNNELLQLRNDYSQLYSKYVELINQKSKLSNKLEFIDDEKEFLKIKLKNFEFIKHHKEEDLLKLINKEKELSSLINNNEKFNNLLYIFKNEEFDIIDTLINIKKLSKELNLEVINSNTSNYIESIESEIYKIEKLINSQSELQEEFEEISEIKDSLNKLQKKYGDNVQEIYKQKKILEEQLEELNNIEYLISELKKEISAIENKMLKTSNTLLEKRRPIMDLLAKEIESDIKEMGMENAKIKFNINDLNKFCPNGNKLIELQLKPNLSSNFENVESIASGGEKSRLLLSFFKNTNKNNIFLFDEVDTGLSGETAFKMGEIIKNLSVNNQVICITHLTQVACFNDELFFVSKLESPKNTFSEYRKIENKDKNKYISKLLIENESSLSLVEDLMKRLKKGK